MRIALVRWREERDGDLTRFVPDVDLDQLDSWGVIDLRGSGKAHQSSADGVALMVAPNLDTPIPGALIDLGDDHQTRLGTTVGRVLANRLGLNLVEATPGRIAAELLTLHARADDDSKPNPLVGERRFPRSKTDQRRRQRVWCAGVLLYDELGAHVDEEMAYVETWPVNTSNIGTATNLDLDWDNASTNSAMQVNSGAAIPSTVFTECAHRMATDLGSADHYVEVITSVTSANSHFPGAVVRMTNASLAESYAWGVRENLCAIRKYSAATTFTEIASNSTARSINVQYTSRIEANGSTLTGSVSGVELVSTTDTAYTASRVGVMAQALGTIGSILGVRVHRWEADVLGGGGEDVEAEIAHGLVVGHSLTAEAAADAAIAHGLTLGHAVEAQVGTPVTATVAHGLTVGHAMTADLAAEATVAHGLVLSHALAADLAVDATVAHGLAVGHAAAVDLTVTAAIGSLIPVVDENGDPVLDDNNDPVFATGERFHGLVVGHQMQAMVGSAVSAEVSHGLVVSHDLAVDLEVEAAAEHGLTVGHSLAATVGTAVTAAVSHGLVVGHAAAVDLDVSSSIAHGLVVGHALAADAAVDAAIAHGLVVGHEMAAFVGDAIEATITHGLVISHELTAEKGGTEAAVAHGLVVGHQVQAFIGKAVTATVDHGLVVSHALTAERGATEATVAHGLVIAHALEARITVDVEVDIAHRLVISHALAAEEGATEAVVGHGLVVDHRIVAMVGSAIAAQINHGLVLAHQGAAAARARAAIGHRLQLGHAMSAERGPTLVQAMAGLVLAHRMFAQAGPLLAERAAARRPQTRHAARRPQTRHAGRRRSSTRRS